MAKNDGTIRERSRGVYEVSVPAGRDAATGRYKRLYRTVHGSKQEARRVRDEMRRELETGLRIDATSLTFAQWADEYIELRRAKGTSEGVLSQYRTRLGLMSRLLGGVRLGEIDARMVEALLRRIKEERATQGIPCSGSTLNHYFALLKRCLQTAVDLDALRRNPCARVQPPKKNAPSRESLTDDEAARFLQKVDEAERDAIADLLAKEQRQFERGNSRDRSCLLGLRVVSLVLMTRLALATGMRLGELLALPWGNVDFAHSQIRVRQAMDNANRLKLPKSQAGIRDIFADGATMGHLASWRTLQGSLLDSIGVSICDESPVFCTQAGEFIPKASFRHWWGDWRKEAGFPGLAFHSLRHTQATALLSHGMDIKSVQARLGHSNASLTLNVYSHAVPNNDAKAAQLIGDLFSGASEPPALVSETA